MLNKLRFSAIVAATALVFAMALPATAQDLDSMDDEAWLELSGTVTSVSADEFKLDYGNGIVRVEMDSWNDAAQGYYVSQGDRVKVLGKIDDDVVETLSIEAASLYVEDHNTYFYANPADEEDINTSGTRFARRVSGMNSEDIGADLTTVVGTVTAVDGREFTIDAGASKLVVDTSEMSYNPLDEEGFQQIETGDRVRVIGKINSDLTELLEGRELTAESVTTLMPAMK